MQCCMGVGVAFSQAGHCITVVMVLALLLLDTPSLLVVAGYLVVVLATIMGVVCLCCLPVIFDRVKSMVANIKRRATHAISRQQLRVEPEVDQRLLLMGEHGLDGTGMAGSSVDVGEDEWLGWGDGVEMKEVVAKGHALDGGLDEGRKAGGAVGGWENGVADLQLPLIGAVQVDGEGGGADHVHHGSGAQGGDGDGVALGHGDGAASGQSFGIPFTHSVDFGQGEGVEGSSGSSFW